MYNICYALLEYRYYGESDLHALGQFFELNLGTGPLVVDYEASVEAWNSTEYLYVPVRQLLYRYCTEASFFHTSNSLPEGGQQLFPVDVYINACTAVFSEAINIETLIAGNRRTNVENGGASPIVTNVHITYGSHDPDRLLGPSEDINPTAHVDIVEGEGKYFNLMPPHIDDPEPIRLVKERTQTFILQWLTE